MTATDRSTDGDEAGPEGRPASRGLPAQPAFPPSSWPSSPPPPAASVLTPGQPVAPLPGPPPTSFSFGDVPAVPDAPPIAAEPVTDDLGHAMAPVPPASVAPPAAATAATPGPATASPTSLAITTTGHDAQQLEMELAAARDELKALHEMLEDLPEIFERKFQQRLATVMEHQKHLLADNQALRDRLYSLNPAAADGPPSGSGRPQPLLVPTVARKQGWGQALKRALRLGGEGAPQKISRHDDGRPITA
ncbi:hypothetical protein [Cyanobium gracile]|uniref:Uncharacterized protein n=1 Tax=Cyanobium gracile (strain ATCC 27147 / PCC 6307) TaxID=292564 RepID=K9P7Y6_CYAGP|nr:hypothetical protein [Cyanobium gracile]AFY29517.1 hypothetical protein Cyagr_2411 [Cyanobium gracile PCC 6307]